MTKIEIFPPPKKKYLIFEDHHSKIVKKLIYGKKNIAILHTRLEKLNLFILFKSLLKFNFRFYDYFQEYINHVKPKFLITILDNYSNFYKFKCNSGKKVVIQNGKRTLLDIFYEFENKKNFKGYHVDKMFLHNYSVANEYKKYLKTDFCVIGSIWSNFQKIKYNKPQKNNNEITLISSFRENYISNEGFVFNKIRWENYIYYEKKFLRYLNKFLRKNNYKLKILSKYGNQIFEKEKKYYLDFFDKKNIMILKNKNRDTFKFIDSASAIIGFESTLMYEAFGRGKKVYFLGIRGKSRLLRSRNFAWPHMTSEKGLFWNNTLKFHTFDKEFQRFINLSQSKWKDLFIKYRNKVMSYDKDNKKIKEYLN